jgi:phosphoribosylglycinamide formyltransferase 1
MFYVPNDPITVYLHGGGSIMGERESVTVGVLASGGGTNMQAIIDATRKKTLDAKVAVVISNNSDSGALQRARDHDLAAVHLSRLTHPESDNLDVAIRDTMRSHGVTWIVLAGYMRPIGQKTLTAYVDRILNIHPALLPKFGGKGMYGMHVHKAVIAAGDTESGATVHLVTREYDEGPVLAQRKVPVQSDDTPEALQKRVLAEEHRIYVDVMNGIIRGTIELPG